MTDQDVQKNSSPIEFPCDFMIKVMGKNQECFSETVLKHIQQHFPTITAKDLSTRPSKDGNYLAISVTVHAESQQILDNLYQKLTDDPAVLMAL